MKTFTYAVGTVVLLLLGIANDLNSKITQESTFVVPEKKISDNSKVYTLESEQAVILFDRSCPDNDVIHIKWTGSASTSSQGYLEVRESVRDEFERYGLYTYLGSNNTNFEVWFVSYGRFENPCRVGEIIRGEIRESPEVEEDDD